MNVVVWDAPSAVVAGERFRTKVGIKCSSNCHLTNKDFRIYDAKGLPIEVKTDMTATMELEIEPAIERN